MGTLKRLKELTQKTAASERKLSDDILGLAKHTQTLSEGLSEAQAQLKDVFEFQRSLREDVDGQRETLDQVASRQLDSDQRLTNLLRNANDLETGMGTVRD